MDDNVRTDDPATVGQPQLRRALNWAWAALMLAWTALITVSFVGVAVITVTIKFLALLAALPALLLYHSQARRSTGTGDSSSGNR